MELSMRFKTIAIENVFSYYGLKKFNFENTDEPVALIIGEMESLVENFANGVVNEI